MAAEYPTSVPTFPANGAQLSTAPHSTLHTKAAEEVTAIATELGTAPKTITQATSPAASPTSVAQFLDMVATHLKAILGTTNWYDAVPLDLTAALAKFATTAGAGGHVHDASAGDGPLIPNINGNAVAGTLPTDRQVMQWNNANTQWEPLDLIEDIVFEIDGHGAEIADNKQGDRQINFDCEIVSVTLLADQSGSIVVDLWKDTYANYPATDADSITASAPPTISTAVKATDATLTGWTKQITAGDTIRYNVDSCTTIQRATLILKVKRN